MNILVTGGAGFIGSHLCEQLIKNNHEVIVIDDLSSGCISNLSKVFKKITFYENKLEEFNFDCLSEIDSVVHLSSQTSVPVSIKKYSKSSSSNMLSSINIIDFCANKNIPLVYASSAAVYGNLNVGDDLSNEKDLLSPYAVDKYSMELYAKMANKLYGLSSIGLRFFNVYGPRQDPKNSYSGVISIFCDSILNDKSITVYGGKQTRDFIYVGDVAASIIKSIDKVIDSDISETINILTGRSTSIDSIADTLIQLTGKPTKKIYKDLPAGDPKGSPGTSSKMLDILGVDQTNLVKIEDGLSATIDYFRY